MRMDARINENCESEVVHIMLMHDRITTYDRRDLIERVSKGT